jgi:chromosome segregation ATPase
MSDNDATIAELQERLDEANAQIEALQASAADAAALSATLEEARGRLREASARYREARLKAHPDVPPDMVAEADDIDEIDRQVEAAERLVGQLRERLQAEPSPVIAPAGSPARRGRPDLSGMSASEKIRLGLQSKP